MPEPTYPHIFRIPTALDWGDTKARLLARVDALHPGQTLGVQFFVDDRRLARVELQATESSRAAAEAVQSLSAEVESLPDFPGTASWPLRGSADIRLVAGRDDKPAPGSCDLTSYTDHRSRPEIDAFLHHVHYTPIGRGLTDAYVDRAYPGRTWQGLVLVLQAAGIVVGRGMNPPQCLPNVETLHFTDAGRWAVEWDDGTTTPSL